MTLSKKSFFVILCLQALALAPLLAQSQANTGSIEGVVTDQTGAAVPKSRSDAPEYGRRTSRGA